MLTSRMDDSRTFRSMGSTFVERTNASKDPKILYVDSLNSRENYEAMCYLRENNITVMTFPPHTTHILKTFDTTMARFFRSFINKFYKKGDESNSTERYLLYLSIEAAWSSCINFKVTAFSMTRLYPFDPGFPLSSQYGVTNDLDFELEERNSRI